MTNFNFQVTTGILPKFEPSIAVNLLIPGIMVATATDHTDGESPKVGLYRSLNGGDSWTQTLLPLPPGGFFTGAECASVAYKFPSTFIVSAHVFPGHQYGSTFVYISNDNGATFSDPILVAPGYGTYINNDETFLIADNGQSSPYLGNVYVVRACQFNVANGANITAFFHRSTDGGLTWDTPVLLSSTSDKVRRPAVTVDLEGIIYTAWITVNGNDGYFIRRSLDGGTTFGPPILVSPVDQVPLVLPVPGYGFRVLTYPSISCDRSVGPNTGAVYAVWQDNREGYADIFMSKSSNQGLNWSNPVSITGAPAGFQNFFPFVDVDPLTGVVNVVYYSNQVNGFDLDVFVARSINGGQTFTNTRITNVSFNPNTGAIGPDPVTVIGDYITITSVPPGGYIATWMSTSPGSQTIFAGYSDIVIP